MSLQWKDAISQRGFSFLHVIGRLYTQQEEKNDVRDPSMSLLHLRLGTKLIESFLRMTAGGIDV